MTATDTYDDLRPYYDSEIPAALERISKDPTLDQLLSYALPGADHAAIREKMKTIRTSDEFQMSLMKPLLESIIRGTMSSFTIGGTDNIDPAEGHVYISNHRDIVLDGALLQFLLISAGLPTSEITFGSNLVSSSFIEDFGRSNKMFKIVRGGSVRDLIRNSHILSKHLHAVVDQGRSIWISQRDGRTKNGDDRTDQGLVKMFTMYGEDDIYASLKSLNIVPVAISYEYESCDALKAREIYLRRRGTYSKEPGEDMKSILTGVQQYKGEVHMEVCPAISANEIDGLRTDSNNEALRNMASLIDSRIHKAYKLYGTNYIAYDIMEGTPAHSDKYNPGEREEFVKYLHEKIRGIDGDRDELFGIMLDIYANPVKNQVSEPILSES